MTADSTHVVESTDSFAADTVFDEGHDQVVLAVRITPVFGQLDLGLLATIVEEANTRGFTLARERPFRDEWLLCVFEAYDDEA